MSIEYRPLLPDEESDFFASIAHALGITDLSWSSTFRENIGADNLRAILQDGQLRGGLGIYRMGQWFGGRMIPCGGISIVGITPEARGQGLAKVAMQSLLEEMSADGTPLACLFPSTQRLYRAVGFEQAGSWCRYKLPLSYLDLVDRDLPVTEVDHEALPALTRVAQERARMSNGNVERSAGLWNRITRGTAKPSYVGLIGSIDDPQGYVCYRHEDTDSSPLLHVTDMAALTPPAMRRLWTFLADHRSISTLVSWTGPPTDPLLALAADCKRTPIEPLRWMLRIVDLKNCLEARGYPAEISEELHLEVTDELLAGNNGRFVLHVHEGQGTITTGGEGHLRLDIRGLAPLFSSFFSPRILRSLGWMDGDDSTLQSAARIFTGPSPWMPETF